MQVGQPTLDQLRIFLAVADEGSFNAAAKRLGRAISAVSYGVAQLEAQLGTSLFEREGSRRPVLTEAGDVQVMSAGTGIRHSEYNLENEETRIFQIWIMPNRRGHAPSWGARPFPKGDRSGRFVPLASGNDNDGDALRINADARVLGATIRAGETVTYETAPDRHAYLVPAAGKVRVEEVEVNARDGAAITGVSAITVTAIEDSEVVLVDAA